MNEQEMKERTKQFALRVIKLVAALPETRVGEVIGKQLVRSGTSVGANYRAACRAKSKKDFVYKINVVEEEADESLFWLEMIREASLLPANRVDALLKEADELTAIMTATGRTAKQRMRAGRGSPDRGSPDRGSPDRGS